MIGTMINEPRLRRISSSLQLKRSVDPQSCNVLSTEATVSVGSRKLPSIAEESTSLKPVSQVGILAVLQAKWQPWQFDGRRRRSEKAPLPFAIEKYDVP